MIFDYLFEFLLAWFGRRLKLWRRQRQVTLAKAWPQASGRGLGAHAEGTGPPYATYTAQVSYFFIVDGEYYSGYVSLPADDEKNAEGLALGWKDREIIVRYSPGDVTESTLLLEDQSEPLKATQNG